MTIRVTMSQTRLGEAGSLLEAGLTYTVSDEFGAWLIGRKYATDTDALLPESSQEQARITLSTTRLAELVATSQLVPNTIYVVGTDWFRATSASAYIAVGAGTSDPNAAEMGNISGGSTLTAATQYGHDIWAVSFGGVITLAADLATGRRMLSFVPAAGQPDFTVAIAPGVTVLQEAGTTLSSAEAVGRTVIVLFQADGVVRVLSGVKLSAPLANQAVLGQANANTIAIFGNSVTTAGVSPRLIYAASTWNPGVAMALNAVAGPRYWNLQAGISANKWVCTTAGNTGAIEPDWPHGAATGTTVADGSVVWTYTALAGSVTPWCAWNAAGFWHIAQALSGQRMREAIIVGRSGAQSNEILGYVDRAIADINVGTIYFANIFENDTWPGVAPVLATITSRWNAFVVKADSARAAGKRVMVQTLLPTGNADTTSGFTGYVYGNGSKAWQWLNNKIREFSRARGDVILFDAATIYADANPANPIFPENTVTYLSGAGTGQQLKKTDGIHPNVSAHWLIGVELAKLLTANFQSRTIFSNALDYKASTVNPANFGTSGTRDATIGSGTVPNSLTMIAYGGTAGSCVASSVPRTDINGNWAQLVYVSAAGDNANLNWTASQAAPFSAGDVVQAFGEIGVSANPTLLTTLYLQIRMLSAADQWAYSGTFSSSDQDLGQMITADTVFTLKTMPLVWPAGVTAVNMYLKASGRGAASFTARFGRMQALPYAVSSAA
jgi:hypothetical protein